MSVVDATRAIELISNAAWPADEVLRAFWIQVDGPRDGMAQGMQKTLDREEVFTIVVRNDSFTVPNRILADMHQLLESNKDQLNALGERRPERLTIVVLVKENFTKAQIGSPITLPSWFPVRPGLDTHFFLTDLLGSPEGTLLNCPEARIDKVAELVFDLETVLVNELQSLNARSAPAADNFVAQLPSRSSQSASTMIARYRAHLTTVAAPRAYRPNAGETSNSLVSDLLRLFLSVNVDDLARAAKILAVQLPKDSRLLKPPYLGVMLRPRVLLTTSGKNWFALLVGLYQAYQMMNAAAHAGDYGHYAPALIHHSSRDLQLFLEDAQQFF